MCGIAGVVSLNKSSIRIEHIKKMIDVISHRGPDDAGYLFFHTGARHNPEISFSLNLTDNNFKKFNQLLPSIEDKQVQSELHSHDWDLFLGHRRLAIIDLTPQAHQPMSDLTKNIWVVYNGEIYNFQNIKQKLQKLGHRFKSNSDTEVIIYSYIQWGIDCINTFNGMFAFALYDNFKKKLYLARDRYGIKPLYYTETNGTIIFSSEIKSILQYPEYCFDIELEGMIEYFTFQNFFTDKTLYKGIRILPPGYYLEIDLLNKHVKKVQYWDFDFQVPNFIKDEKEYIEELQWIFEQAVKRQLISDVELGSYLSGGMDTGSITAITSKHINNLKTFTIGFDLHSASGLELGCDEREYAEQMSYLFKTEHYEMVLKAGDMERCLPTFAYHLEEPRVGQSYPNFYASKLASKFVKVVLSGTGGDELFGGYPWRYFIGEVKNFEDYVDKYYLYWQRLIPNGEIKKVFSPIWNQVKHISTREIFKNVFKEQVKPKTIDDFLNYAFYLEAKTFLHGLLIVEDKLSMAYSLETRVPFLDNELVDFATKLPPLFKIKIQDIPKIDENLPGKRRLIEKVGAGKQILRKAMKKYLPNSVLKAPKQGFSAPDATWFRGDSINYVKSLLYNNKALIYNFIDKNNILRLVDEHIAGKKNRRLLIWSLINFEWWLRINLGERLK